MRANASRRAAGWSAGRAAGRAPEAAGILGTAEADDDEEEDPAAADFDADVDVFDGAWTFAGDTPPSTPLAGATAGDGDGEPAGASVF